MTGARKSFALQVKSLGLQSWDCNALLRRSQSSYRNVLGILQSQCVLFSLYKWRNKVTGWLICGKQTLFNWPVRLPFCRQRRKVSAISWFCSSYLKAVGMYLKSPSGRDPAISKEEGKTFPEYLGPLSCFQCSQTKLEKVSWCSVPLRSVKVTYARYFLDERSCHRTTPEVPPACRITCCGFVSS